MNIFVHTFWRYCCIVICYNYTHIHAEYILTQWIKTSEDFLKEIYLSLYLKGLCVWEGVGDRTELQYIDPHSYGHQRCVFLVLLMLNRRPGDTAFCWLSLPHLVTNSPVLQLNWFPVFTELYNSSITHSVSILMASRTGICYFRRLWTDMFDHHQTEITVMQFRGHSLPVHQSMSVPWDFTLPHFVSQARLRDFFS